MQMYLCKSDQPKRLYAAFLAVRHLYAGLRRKAVARLVLLCAWLLLAGAAQAQTGNVTVDASFDPGAGAGGSIWSIALQTDGKVLIGGDFTTFNGTPRNHIARLNADGSLDTDFDPSGTGANQRVQSIVVQPDGKVLIGGAFTTFNGTPINRIARLNDNGSLDTSFNPGSGVNDWVDSIALQSDGKVLIAGQFTTFNGTPINRIARLNDNGTLDTSFNPGSGVDNSVWAVTLQTNGKILINGLFTTFNGTPRNRIARLNDDGSLDTSFDPGTGANDSVWAMTLQTDGKMLIGGNFTTFNGTPRTRIARLNTNGTLDTSFDPGAGTNASVYPIILQSDGKLLIAGQFTTFNGTARNRIARLNADGSLDTSFDPGAGANGSAYSMALQPDGKALMGGPFTEIDGTARTRIARLTPPVVATASVPVVGQGSISPAIVGVVSGATTSFALTPNAGYVVDTVTGTCGGTLSGTTYTTTTLTADCTVIASFKPAAAPAGSAAATPVPTLAPWALAGLLAVIGLWGGRRLRRV